MRAADARQKCCASTAIGALTERWNPDADDVQPIQQVGTKAPGCDRSPHVTIGGSYEANVDLPAERLTETPDLLLLDDAQQLGLPTRREIRNFIKKESAVVGILEESCPVCHGAGKRSATMTE